MEEVYCLQQLPHHPADQLGRHPPPPVTLQLLQDGALHVLKHQAQPVILTEGFQELHNPVVVQLLEYAGFTQGGLPHLWRLGRVSDHGPVCLDI